jgi:hypothetical protein
MKMTAFCNILPRSLLEVYQRFRGSYCLHHPFITLMMEAVRTSETSVCFNEITRRYVPEDFLLQKMETQIWQSA